MKSQDAVLTALREANPVLVEVVEDRPTVAEILDRAQQPTAAVRDVSRPRPGVRPVVVVAAVFAAVLLIGIAAFAVTANRSTSVVPTEPGPTVPAKQPSTTTTESTATTEGERALVIEPGTQAVLEEFEDRYTAGDVDGLLALVAPGVAKTTKRDSEPESLWDMNEVRYQIEIDALLNTALMLVDCQPLLTGSVSCTARRDNDLTRIAGVGPQEDLVVLRVEQGEITLWQDRQGVDATPYQWAAVAPFTAWLAGAHPQIEDPHPMSGGVRSWWLSRDISNALPDLVAEYAASVGYQLGA